MATMKLIYTTSAKLDALPQSDGQIIFAPNDNIISLDLKGKRFTYRNIKILDTDVLRTSLSNPFNHGFYYILETNILWQYVKDKWIQITPSNLTPVQYYNNINDFPIEGNDNTLYYTNTGIYSWHTSTNEYGLIANVNTWESI